MTEDRVFLTLINITQKYTQAFLIQNELCGSTRVDFWVDGSTKCSRMRGPNPLDLSKTGRYFRCRPSPPDPDLSRTRLPTSWNPS